MLLKFGRVHAVTICHLVVGRLFQRNSFMHSKNILFGMNFDEGCMRVGCIKVDLLDSKRAIGTD